jgi:hypothetical protein
LTVRRGPLLPSAAESGIDEERAFRHVSHYGPGGNLPAQLLGRRCVIRVIEVKEVGLARQRMPLRKPACKPSDSRALRSWLLSTRRLGRKIPLQLLGGHRPWNCRLAWATPRRQTSLELDDGPRRAEIALSAS